MVINPISGNTDKQPIIDMAQEFMPPESKLTIYRTTGKEDVAKLQKKIKDFGPERILVVGGDGTIKMTAQACGGDHRIIGIIPAGSANGLATDLELPTDSKGALKVAMGDRTQKMDALRINDSIGLHISDMGINAELIKNYSEGAVRGHFGYFLNSIPTLWESESPYRFSISANGEKMEVEAVMIAFANSQKFGTGALVNPNAKIDDGKFEILIFKELNVIEILKTLRGDIEMDTDFVEVIETTEARVTSEREVAFQIDGESFGKIKNVSASIIPHFLEVATG